MSPFLDAVRDTMIRIIFSEFLVKWGYQRKDIFEHIVQSSEIFSSTKNTREKHSCKLQL